MVAVSGGVDSVVLLNMLSKQQNLQLIATHFNHGIRKDSVTDELFVSALARSYGCQFEVGLGNLGPKASEETARKARYKFLEKIKSKYKAKGIITAHHQDDVIETAIINIMRGTSNRGLSSLKSGDKIIRPLLALSKAQIYDYATANKLKWREDPTNNNQEYLRNWVRLNIMPKMPPGSKSRKEFLTIINNSKTQTKKIDENIAGILQMIIGDEKNRQIFISLPDSIAKETASSILKSQGVKDLNKKMITNFVVFVKTAKAGSKFEIDKNFTLKVSKYGFTIFRS